MIIKALINGKECFDTGLGWINHYRTVCRTRSQLIWVSVVIPLRMKLRGLSDDESGGVYVDQFGNHLPSHFTRLVQGRLFPWTSDDFEITEIYFRLSDGEFRHMGCINSESDFAEVASRIVDLDRIVRSFE